MDHHCCRPNECVTGQVQWTLIYCTVTMLFGRAYSWLPFTGG